MQRFLWLNLPSRSDLVDTIKLPANNIFALSLICGEGGKRRFEQEALRRLLRLSELQWRRATLDMSTVASQTCPEMRFCPECLADAYHTVVFQLLTVPNCPVHGCTLVRGCPRCGKEIPATLKSCLLRTPFACPQCKNALAEARVIVDSPGIGSGRQIAAIATWYRWVGGLPRAESRPLPQLAREKLEIDSPVLPLLERAGRKPAPDTVKLNRRPLMEGSVLMASFGKGVFENHRQGNFYRERRNASFYKSYRRHLQKQIPGALWLMRTYARRPDRILAVPISTCSQEAKTAAFALLLFRQTMEGWKDAHGLYGRPSRLCAADRGFEIPFESAGLGPGGGINRFPCSEAERQWLLDHFFCEAIRGVFAEAALRTHEMVRSGACHVESLSPSESDTRPYSLGIFDPQGRLEFWSLRLREGQERAGVDREEIPSSSGAGEERMASASLCDLKKSRRRTAAPPGGMAPCSSEPPAATRGEAFPKIGSTTA
jgi:hypothetical protein